MSGTDKNPFPNYDLREDYPDLNVPPGIFIPTTDDGAWEYFTKHRWVYNKLEVALSQGLKCGPVGAEPSSFPVFMKPIINLYGTGLGSSLIINAKEYEHKKYSSGYFWMEYLEGDHLSHDLVVVDGKVVFCLTFKGHSLGKGMFDFWETAETPSDALEYITHWVQNNLQSYSGSVNMETIGGKIIECHLRMGDINSLYNYQLMQCIIDVYAGKGWDFRETIAPFYLFALWGDWGVKYHLDLNAVEQLCEELTYYQIEHPDDPQNPPGGVRLALLCDYDKEKCIRVRNALFENFSPKPGKPKTDKSKK